MDQIISIRLKIDKTVACLGLFKTSVTVNEFSLCFYIQAQDGCQSAVKLDWSGVEGREGGELFWDAPS